MCKSKNLEMTIGFRAFLILITFGICTTFFVEPARATTYTVTNTNDTGTGSLRSAILTANANPGFDVIYFNIPGVGVKTIMPLTPLPTIRDSVVIDGWKQGAPGYEGPPLIEISGTNVRQPNVPGLRIGCSLADVCPDVAQAIIEVNDSTIRGLIINDFQGTGLSITGDNNTVQGCYIGITSNGEAALPNSGNGIRVQGSGNLIGGSSDGARNVISGNNVHGVAIEANDGPSGSTSNNRIEGNYIGTGSDGITGGLGNQGWGVSIGYVPFAVNNTVGGLTARSGNVISGNGGSSTWIGGGVLINAAGTRVQNNLIGVGADRTTEMGNLGTGVQINTHANQIGGVFTPFVGRPVPTGNVIAFNQGAGISVFDSTFLVGNRISHNNIYVNWGLGIDLGQNGVTDNDFCDFDTGPNNLQNFPVLTSVGLGPGRTVQISGYIPGNIVSYRIEFFNSPTCGRFGNGEGERYIGSVNTGPVSPFCRVNFVATLSNITLGELDFITATATDPDGNTSEFSRCLSAR